MWPTRVKKPHLWWKIILFDLQYRVIRCPITLLQHLRVGGLARCHAETSVAEGQQRRAYRRVRT